MAAAVTKGAESREGTPPRAAVVVPLSARAGLLPEEQVSMRHLCHFLGRYDRYLVAPPGLPVEREGFTVVRWPRKFFGTAAAYNLLMLWQPFYERFADYDYILIYHLDSLVFGDELSWWCRRGHDYIGAPWIPCADTPWVTEPRVGNGGFALMKVRSVLDVLRNRHAMDRRAFWSDLVARQARTLGPMYQAMERLPTGIQRSRMVRGALRHWRVNQDPGRHGWNNDYFWSYLATRYLPAFDVADVEEGLRFAFEAAPRRCLEMTGGRLPFGCHAWARFDRTFWEPHLLPPGDPHAASLMPASPPQERSA